MARVVIDIPDSLMAFAEQEVAADREESLSDLLSRLLADHRGMINNPDAALRHLKADLEAGLAEIARGEIEDGPTVFQRLRKRADNNYATARPS